MDTEGQPADHCIRSTAAPTPTGLPVDFDTGFQGVNDFGGAATIASIDPDDANNRVLRTQKPNGADNFAGSTVLDINQPIAFPSSTDTVFTMDVLAPAANIPVLLKVEFSGDGSQFAEIAVNTSTANQWETLSFNLGNLSSNTNFDRLSVFFDSGSSGNGNIYLWDNIQLSP